VSARESAAPGLERARRGDGAVVALQPGGRGAGPLGDLGPPQRTLDATSFFSAFALASTATRSPTFKSFSETAAPLFVNLVEPFTSTVAVVFFTVSTVMEFVPISFTVPMMCSTPS